MPMAPRAIIRGAIWRDWSGKMLKEEAQDGVEAELAGEDHDGGGGGLRDASESQPWSGKTGTLTAKATRKASEASQRAAELPEMLWAGGELCEVGELEGAGAGVDPEHADEQDGGGDEGVEEVLDGGATAVGRCGRRWR